MNDRFKAAAGTAMEYTNWRHRHGDFSLDCLLPEGKEMRWYLLNCYRDVTVAAGLVARGFGVYLPMLSERVGEGEAARVVQSPMYPGLVFICVRDIEEQRARILSVPGVLGIVRCNGEAVVVPDSVVDRSQAIEIENDLKSGLIALEAEDIARSPAKQKKRRKKNRDKRRELLLAQQRLLEEREWKIRIMCRDDPAARAIDAALTASALGTAAPEDRRDLLYRAMGLRPPTESLTPASASGIDNP
jgi:transcription antitermination factor NusG